jgi:hypothetical protein
MAAPVIIGEKMVFILPEGINRDNAPKPHGQAIDVTELR